jgi:hypothetical protein
MYNFYFVSSCLMVALLIVGRNMQLSKFQLIVQMFVGLVILSLHLCVSQRDVTLKNTRFSAIHAFVLILKSNSVIKRYLFYKHC